MTDEHEHLLNCLARHWVRCATQHKVFICEKTGTAKTIDWNYVNAWLKQQPKDYAEDMQARIKREHLKHINNRHEVPN